MYLERMESKYIQKGEFDYTSRSGFMVLLRQLYFIGTVKRQNGNIPQLMLADGSGSN